MKKIKKFFKGIISKIKNIWKKDPKDILIPIVSILIFIASSFWIGIIRGAILFVGINFVYFLINYFSKKDKKAKLSKKEKKKVKKKRWKIFLLILLIMFIIGIIGIIAFFGYIVVSAPDFNEELLYVTDPTIVLDKDGNEIAKLGAENRETITYEEIPEVLIDAIVATEDSRFFEHSGVDWARFLKASFQQVLGMSEAGGASTLTMQVSKNTHTSTEASGVEGIIRKFTDVYISMFKIEKNYSKEQIMEFYVNAPYLGRNAYGVEQVALTYFNKSAKDLNLAEAAMIAGLFQAPGRYDPYTNPEVTEARRQTVLKLMLRHDYITKKEYNIAKNMTVEKIVIPRDESSSSALGVSEYQSFIDTVVDEVKKKTGLNPYTTPMIIHTTMNTDFQQYVNDIMYGRSYNWENDVVQAGVAVVDINNGSLVAVGGNRKNDAIDNWNYATEIENQIGSTAKPLYDYGPGIQYQNWSTYNIFVDEPITYSDGTKINNWNGAFESFETMRRALKGSRNIPALKAFKANKKSDIIEFVTNLGLTPEIYSCDEGYTLDKKVCINDEDPEDVVDAKKDSTLHEAHAIGGYNGESPLTMAAAYAAFGNGGYYIEPYTFTKLIYQETGEEFINDINKNKAMDDSTAYMVSDMLATTATQAVGGYYNINGIRYAAKTGTTNYDDKAMSAHNMPYSAVNDLWTIGFNTEYSIGVWYGYDNISNEYYNVLSSGQHNRLFQAVGKKVFTNRSYFSRPSSVSEVELEYGCPEPTLPSEFTPKDERIVELFVRGTEPTTVSPRYDKLKDVSNLKSTVNDDTVTLTWNKVETPKINTEAYLKEYFDPIFENDSYLNEFVKGRINYNYAHIGDIGYNIYLKDAKGKLELLDFVTTNKYKTTLDKSGDYTFVVKTAYSVFKPNMSDGKSIKVSVEIKSPIIPIPDDEELNNTNTNNSTNENSNQTQNNNNSSLDN